MNPRIQRGILRSWHEDRGFGIIEVSRKERYFLHITQLNEDSNPVVGAEYSFDVAPGAIPANRLPSAVNASIIKSDVETSVNKQPCANPFRCHKYVIPDSPQGIELEILDDHDGSAGTAIFTGYCSLNCLLLDVWHELGNNGEKIGDQIRALKTIIESLERSAR